MHIHRWTIERRITLPLIITLFIQFLSVVVWATYLDARVAALESSQIGTQDLNVRFGRLEERLDAVRGELVIIRQHLDRTARNR